MLLEKLGVPSDQHIPPISIGAGPNKNFHHPEELKRYSNAAAMTHGVVVIGSITPEPNPGNEGDLWYKGDGFTQNSYGMPNDGIEAMPEIAPLPNLIVSLAGKTVGDYIRMYNRRWDWGIGVELNFGCPNMGSGDRIMSFVPDLIESTLTSIRLSKGLDSEKRQKQIIGIKLSPYSDPVLLKEVALMLCRFEGTLDYIATCNTFPNVKAFRRSPRDGRSTIVCKNTSDRGGMGGEALRQPSLGNAIQFVEIFDAESVDIDVVRVGGITDAVDILDSQDAGCKGGVQVVSDVMESVNPIYRMAEGYAAITM